MPQFLIDEIISNQFTIKGLEANHLIKSYRIKLGERLHLIARNEDRYIGVVKKITKNTIYGEILEKKPFIQKKYYLHLHQALIKKQNFELILRKATELDVDEITPIITKRTVVREIQFKRHQKIMVEATKQSMRQTFPKLNPVKKYEDILESLDEGSLNLLGYEAEKSTTLKKIFSQLKSEYPKTINLIIGPEGGFTEDEINLAKTKNINIFSLGRNTLTSETAAISSIAIINCLMENTIKIEPCTSINY